MKKTLILLAGYPGTGKSYLCDMIIEQVQDFHILSPDTIKEELWDELGFENEKEKNLIAQLSWSYYYVKMKELFLSNKLVISDYPFSDKQRDFIEILAKKFDYQVITIRLIADLDILFRRQKKRDLGTTRHTGHIVNCYNNNNSIQDRSNMVGVLDYNEFLNRCTSRGYGTFHLGHLIEIDVSSFETVDYAKLLNQIESLIQE